MNPLSELMSNEILTQNELRRADPIPEGAVIGLDNLIAYVNEHQTPTPESWRAWDVYKEATPHPSNEHLRDVIIPQSMALLYMVMVPRKKEHSHIQEIHVPKFHTLTHNPADFGFSEKLDRERKAKIPRHFPVWIRSTKRGDQFRLNYQHIETLGILPEKRNNDWATFFSMKAAEEYLAYIKVNARPETELSAYISQALAEDVFGDTA